MGLRRLGLAILAAALPAGAAAQNMVSNGDFATNVAGWTFSGSGSFLWNPLDWQVSGASGSGILGNTAFPMDTFVTASQCIPFAPSGPLEFGAHVRVPSGQSNVGQFSVWLRFHDNATCTPPVTGGDIVIVPPGPLDTWRHAFKTGVVAPVTTQSALVMLYVLKELMGTSIQAHFDRVVFGPAGTTPVQLQSFAVE